ncbi:alkaline phosphatase family protein [Geminocystis sp. CENA526]|uniref:alkaline phosphatase family protein n=1 Tax=Geminocystis sp. CENA526 TaxID=1355871 RepID=UPI003D6F30B0
MINQRSFDKVKSSLFFNQEWRMPCCEDYYFGNIPNTIAGLFDLEQQGRKLPKDTLNALKEKYSTVVFFFLDAFGWSFFQQALSMDLPAVKRFVNDGNVSLITSMFPSTTAVHVHTFNTNIPPSQTGIYEWRMYEKSIDTLISPLMFSTVEDIHIKDKDHKRDTLVTRGIAKPEDIFTVSPYYRFLQTNGITVYDFCPQEFVNSSYNTVVTAEINRIGYESYETGIKHLYEKVFESRKQKEKGTFIKFYSPLFDSVSHDKGGNSQELNDALKYFFTLLENEFFKPLSQDNGKDVAIILSADHGHIDINPNETIYLDKEMPEIIDYFATTNSGIPLYPCGSRRDLFLHVKEEYRQELKRKLSKILEGKAKVFYIEEIMKLFGDIEVSKRFEENVGNLVILPLGNQGVFLAGENGKYKKGNIGEHGGLSSEEMDIPFGVLNF